MTAVKDIKVTEIQCFDSDTKEVISLSWGIKDTLHKMARKTVHPMHVFDYDKVVIMKTNPPKLKGTVKLYEASYAVLLMSGKKIKHSLNGISLAKEGYRPFIKDLVRK